MSRKAPIQSCRSRSTIGVIIRNKIREKLVNIQSKCANMTDTTAQSLPHSLGPFCFFLFWCSVQCDLIVNELSQPAAASQTPWWATPVLTSLY